MNKKLTIVLLLTGCCVGLAAMSFKTPDVQYKNLKVLPKNISSKELNSLMADDFQDALGVTCSFCHAQNADGRGLDYASDAKPEKEITRQMMRMTLGLNKRYLKVKHPALTGSALVVSCNTCHKGQAFPE